MLPGGNLGGDALDLVPGFVLDGHAIAPPLRFEPRLGLAGNEDLLRALSERRRLHEAEEISDLRVEVRERDEALHVETEDQRAVGEEAGPGPRRARAGEDATQNLHGEREPEALVLPRGEQRADGIAVEDLGIRGRP